MQADVASTTGFLNLIVGSGTVAKIVLAFLLVFSIISWAVILERWRLFAKAQKQSATFFKSFQTQTDMGSLLQAASKLPDSPAASVFASVHERCATLLSRGNHNDSASTLDLIFRELNRAGMVQLARFQQRLSLLATAASVCPFVGLFGTVWGIMSSFLNISAKGSTNIVVVAPGIAEALITTIAGLAVAIPAMIAYNYFISQTRKLGLELEDMGTTYLSRIQLQGNDEEV